MCDKISIIVPVYNAEKTIKDCVTSLVNQTYKNIEIILVNDGSADNSLSLCRELALTDGRIIVIDKPNGGVSSARNAGICASSGEYVMFCDSDDLVSENWCKCLYDNNEQDCLTMCEIKRFKESADSLQSAKTEGVLSEKFSRDKYLTLYRAGIGLATNKIFRADIIKKNKIEFPTVISLGEDLHFVIEYLKFVKGSIIVLHSELYYYRCDDGASLSKASMTSQQCEFFYNMLQDSFKVFKIYDPVSCNLKNQIVMQHFEKLLYSEIRGKGFCERYRIIKRVFRQNAFMECCKDSSLSSNAIYNMLIQRRLALLFAAYYFKK